MMLLRYIAALALSLTILTTIWPGQSVGAVGGGCENAQFRLGYSASLPDCRAYELVTPAGSSTPIAPLYLTSAEGVGYDLPEGNQQAQAAVQGDRFAYGSEEADAASPGPIYLARRGLKGWSTENVTPPQSVEDGICIFSVDMAGWSADLSTGVLTDGHNRDSKGKLLLCGHDEPELVQGEPTGGWQNLFLRDTETSSYQLVNLTPPAVPPAEAEFDAMSADGSHVVFNEAAQLTANASVGDELYVWAGGQVRLVTVLPGGAPAQGQLAGGTSSSILSAVSMDGARIFFTANGGLYMRENGAQEPREECAGTSSACTLQMDAVQGGPGTSGGGAFRGASVDGSKVFFTDESRLTADSAAQAGRPDLYEYDIDAEEGRRLRDLTSHFEQDGGVLGVSGISQDGSYVYIVSEGVLDAAEENGQHAFAHVGQPNLYVRHVDEHGEQTRFIATLNGKSSDVCDWTALCLTARVSSRGGFIAFDSVSSLTGYDDTPRDPAACTNTVETHLPGSPCIEIYRYDWEARDLRCVSCNPTGEPPVGSTTIRAPTPMFMYNVKSTYADHNVSDGGQVFFDSPDALTPSASNDARNVYEYENERLILLSSGTSSEASYFYDASPDGSNVFLITEQPLLPQDTAAKYAIYDARANGGYLYQSPTPPCEGEACRSSMVSSTFQIPSSVNFVGAGNWPPTTPARVRPTNARRVTYAPRRCTRLKRKPVRVRCKRRASRKSRIRHS